MVTIWNKEDNNTLGINCINDNVLKLLIIIPIVPDSGRFRWLSLWTIWRWHLLPADTGDVVDGLTQPAWPSVWTINGYITNISQDVATPTRWPTFLFAFWVWFLGFRVVLGQIQKKRSDFDIPLCGWVFLHLRWWNCATSGGATCNGTAEGAWDAGSEGVVSAWDMGIGLLNVEMDDEWQGHVEKHVRFCPVWLDCIVCSTWLACPEVELELFVKSTLPRVAPRRVTV